MGLETGNVRAPAGRLENPEGTSPPMNRTCLILVASLTLCGPAFGTTEVLVVYAEPESSTGGLVNARHLEALLGHFPQARPRVVSAGDYEPGLAAGVDLALYIGSPVAEPDEAMVADLARADRLCWLGAGADRLLHHLGPELRDAIAVEGEGDRPYFYKVFYKDATLQRGSSFMVELSAIDPERVRVRAEVGDGSKRRPYALEVGKLWLFADNPLAYFGSRDRYLVFADLLHEILEIDHPVRHSAIVRIADVSPMTDPAELEGLTRILRAEAIPFLVSVVPFYVDPDAKVSLSLAERPELVRALLEMKQIGASIVLHGAAHRHQGTTLADLEFWDAEADRPLSAGGADQVRRKLDAAIVEMAGQGLAPSAWETPGHAASEADYRLFAGLFGTAIETRMATDRRADAYSVPFLVERDRFGGRLLPDNLGYVRADAPDPSAILDSAESIRVVRDGFASVQFHPFVPAPALRDLVRGLRDRGYEFFDLGLTAGEDAQRFAAMADRVGEASGLVVAGGERGGATGAVPSGGVSPSALVSRLLARLPGKRRQPPPASAAWVLWDSVPTPQLDAEQRGLELALEAHGLTIEKLTGGASPPADARLLVAVGATAERLAPADVDAWVEAVRRGAVLVTTGHSRLARAVGVDFGPIMEVRELEDFSRRGGFVRWPSSDAVVSLRPPRAATVLLRDGATGKPLAVAGGLGDGGFLALAGPFSANGSGYDRYPQLPHYLADLGVRARLVSTSLEVFFDPGLRQEDSVEDYVQLWRERGIRVVHAAAWHFYEEYAFDYARLLDLAHRNGILVYAWFEPPQVTSNFWLQRPECREKNYLGADVRPDWRYPIALMDDGCSRQALAEYARVLDAFDWDGVNFAELSFFGTGGFANSEKLTPFHPAASSRFEALHGFDPAELLDPDSEHYFQRDEAAARAFEEFRVDWIVRLHRDLLRLADEAAARRPLGFETVLTLLDSLAVPELRRDLGLDVSRILQLADDHEFSVAVEDPIEMWSQSPRRYESVAQRYVDLGVSKARLLVDINVLEFREAGDDGFATTQQTGVELQELVRASTKFTPRTLVYAEATLYEEDLELMPYALATRASLVPEPSGWRVRTPHPLALDVGADARDIRVNGEAWPARDRNLVLLPAGDHVVTLAPRGVGELLWGRREPGPRIVRCSATILDARRSGEEVVLDYEALSRVALTMSAAPAGVLVDGVEFAADLLPSRDATVVFLPSGRHQVSLRYPSSVAATARRALDHAGHLLLTVVALFGFVACITLLLLLASTTRWQRRARGLP
jgi:hypothetical protein